MSTPSDIHRIKSTALSFVVRAFPQINRLPRDFYFMILIMIVLRLTAKVFI